MSYIFGIIMLLVSLYMVMKVLANDSQSKKRLENLLETVESSQEQLETEYQESIDFAAAGVTEGKLNNTVLTYHTNAKKKFLSMVQMNSKICQHYQGKESKLIEQLTDWNTLMEMYRALGVESLRETLMLAEVNGVKEGASSTLVATANGRVTELEERIKRRV